MVKVYNKYHNDAPEDAVSVMRPSVFGNPFHVAEYGRGEAVARYRLWINEPEQAWLREHAKKKLKGKDLLCCCAPKPCHADILLEIANGP